MTLQRLFGIAILTGVVSLPGWSQQPAPSSSSQPQPAPRIQDDTQEPPSERAQAEQQQNADNDKKKESKIKKKLKDAAPECIGFSGGSGKCRHSQEDEDEKKRQVEEQRLRTQCRDAADTTAPAPQGCADLRRHDSAHDVEVGDNYFDQKSYKPAELRYRSALQTDPTNAAALYKLARVLEKTGRNEEAAEMYAKFLNTDPQGPEQKQAQDALNRLHIQTPR